jgi:hypothetical protein
MDLRQNLALLGNSTSLAVNSSKSGPNGEKKLQQLLDQTFKTIIDQIKEVLANLQAFMASDISFSAKVHFNEPFCKEQVRENLLVPFLKYIAQVNDEFTDGTHDPVPYPLILIMAKLALEFESVAIDYLVSLI